MNPVKSVKNNKPALILAIILVLIVGKDAVSYFFGMDTFSTSKALPMAFESASTSYGGANIGMPKPASFAMRDSFAPAAPTMAADRLVIKDSSLSLVVNSVEETITEIESIATKQRGYMVNSSLSKPEGAATGYISLRVPSENRSQVLTDIKELGTKVVSESVSGQDVTDQFADLESRLNMLSTTKSKFEAMLSEATSVSQTLEVQRELMNLQSQIDDIQGRKMYLEQTAKLSLITINLSTDELALPYAPEASWQPQIVFKHAVRALVSTTRAIVNLGIWIAVFAVIWAPVLVVYKIWQKRKLPFIASKN